MACCEVQPIQEVVPPPTLQLLVQTCFWSQCHSHISYILWCEQDLSTIQTCHEAQKAVYSTHTLILITAHIITVLLQSKA